MARTEKFTPSLYPNCLFEWNKIDPALRASTSVGILKNISLLPMRPSANSKNCIHSPKGIAYLTQLSIGLSKLNFHILKHNSKDTINPICPKNGGIEDTEHFGCSQFFHRVQTKSSCWCKRCAPNVWISCSSEQQ